jgi:hypothetical protein
MICVDRHRSFDSSPSCLFIFSSLILFIQLVPLTRYVCSLGDSATSSLQVGLYQRNSHPLKNFMNHLSISISTRTQTYSLLSTDLFRYFKAWSRVVRICTQLTISISYRIHRPSSFDSSPSHIYSVRSSFFLAQNRVQHTNIYSDK